MITFPHRVYVIELDQPFENWYGDLLSYYPNSDFAEVETNNEVVKKVRLDLILDADSGKPITELLF